MINFLCARPYVTLNKAVLIYFSLSGLTFAHDAQRVIFTDVKSDLRCSQRFWRVQSSSCLRHYATSLRVAGPNPDEEINFFFFNLWYEYQKIFFGCKTRPAHKADNLTAICEPIFCKMWDPRRLEILFTCTACYRNSFTFTYVIEDMCPV
jgi:hypothetical protein